MGQLTCNKNGLPKVIQFYENRGFIWTKFPNVRPYTNRAIWFKTVVLNIGKPGGLPMIDIMGQTMSYCLRVKYL